MVRAPARERGLASAQSLHCTRSPMNCAVVCDPRFRYPLCYARAMLTNYSNVSYHYTFTRSPNPNPNAQLPLPEEMAVLKVVFGMLHRRVSGPGSGADNEHTLCVYVSCQAAACALPAEPPGTRHAARHARCRFYQAARRCSEDIPEPTACAWPAVRGHRAVRSTIAFGGARVTHRSCQPCTELN